MHFLIIISKVLILILSIFIGLCIFQSVIQAQTVLIQSFPDLRVFKRCAFILERPSLKFTRRTKQCLFLVDPVLKFNLVCQVQTLYSLQKVRQSV